MGAEYGRKPDFAAANAGRLDNLGNNLSPCTDLRPEIRLPRPYKVEKYRLRRVAARATPYDAVASCGTRATRDFRSGEDRDVTIKLNEGRASYSGVMTCGRVWLCPVCAAKIAASRRREVCQAVERHAEAGGFVYMATLTLPHWRHDSLRQLRRACAASWTKVIQGKRWKREVQRAGLVGNIRAAEVTENHGQNGHGWHPHLHVLIFLDRLDDADEFGDFLFERWRDRIERQGCRRPSWQAWDWQLCRKPSDAANYIAKGADWELTHGPLKRAKGGGRSPRQILESLEADWNTEDVALWREYAEATKGARQLTWSNGLKKRFGVDDLSDEEAALGEPLVVLPADTYAQLYDRGLEQSLLRAAETGGLLAVYEFLWVLRLHVGLRDPPHD